MANHRDIPRLSGDIIVSTTGDGADDAADQPDGDEAGAAADATAIGGGPVDDATRLAAEPRERVRKPSDRAGAKKDKPQDIVLHSLDELVEFFIGAGKKGVAVNRYKGLGEMNPDQLWATTMDPDVRTLLQVRAEDHTEADLMFTTLMGDQVEPRRKFIEDNALDVKNLDV
jgi:DNA gyrase/topoisomerase IV subunit B